MFFTPCSKQQFVTFDLIASILPAISTVPDLSTDESTPPNFLPTASASSRMLPISLNGFNAAEDFAAAVTEAAVRYRSAASAAAMLAATD